MPNVSALGDLSSSKHHPIPSSATPIIPPKSFFPTRLASLTASFFWRKDKPLQGINS
ncbi:MAG: hypothetical protein V1875_02180 [Candidatus Altiarchaeota archaeon]